MQQPSGTPQRLLPLFRVCALLAGLVLPQVLLYGPSLAGRQILLPLDLLGQPGWYLPAAGEYAGVRPQDYVLSDEVLLFEPERQFAAGEIRAGRPPLWNPHIFLGAPFVVWEVYSPFNLLYCLVPSLVTLAWLQLAKSVVAGVGAYVFFRKVLKVGFWAAALGGWCYPLNGFFTLWQGFPHTEVAAWLPWVLLATDGVIRRPAGWGGPGLAVLTGIVLVTRVDVGAQVLLTSGLYAAWCLWDAHGRARVWRGALAGGAAVAGAWALGFLLAAPCLFPLLEYTRSGDRVRRREAGQEERPPKGLSELPCVVLPEVYGSTQQGSVFLGPGNLLESASGAYPGLFAALLLAPLAWTRPGRGALNGFWAVLALVGLAWALNLPGFVTLMRSPGLNLLSHNRFVFSAAFALLALAVSGLDAIHQGGVSRRRWFLLPALALLALGLWCCSNASKLPEPLATDLENDLRAGQALPNVPDLPTLEQARGRYARYQVYGAVLCGLALAGWLAVWCGAARRRWFAPAVGSALVVELLCFAYGRNPQCDLSLSYPPVGALRQLAEAPPGRVLGIHCLPANLAMLAGLRDVRGYDSVDPGPVLRLLDLARDPESEQTDYARAQWYTPLLVEAGPGELRLPPVLDMLGVRYLVFRRPPPPELALTPLIARDDYWVVENPRALPRAFVPRAARPAPPPTTLLGLLGAPAFDPGAVAYVEGLDSPQDGARGTASVVEETPTRLTLAVDMESPGVVVLADAWSEGWHADRDGEPIPVLRTNHALRGVSLPAGHSTVVFRYEPGSLTWGLRAGALGIGALGLWLLAGWWARRREGAAPGKEGP
jgi:hypothetical protein